MSALQLSFVTSSGAKVAREVLFLIVPSVLFSDIWSLFCTRQMQIYKHIPRSCIHDGYLIGLRGIFHIKVGSCSELNLRDSPSRSFGKSRPILWKSILD